MKKICLILMLFCWTQVVHAQPLQTPYYYGFDHRIDLRQSLDEVLVKFDDAVSSQQALSIISNDPNVSLKDNFWNKWYVLSTGDPAATIADYRANQLVDYAHNTYALLEGARVYPTNQILVKFKSATGQAVQQQLEQSLNLTFVKSTTVYTMYEVNAGDDPIAVANQLQESGHAHFAYPDFLVQSEYTGFTPDDPLFAEQWNFHNTGQTTANGIAATPGADINMPEAWDISKGDKDIVIAVLDGGVTSDHPDLPNTRQLRLNGSNFSADFDGTSPDDPSPVIDENAHGDACAGLIAASHNDEGIAGIAPKCVIMPIRIPLGLGGVPNSVFADALEFAYLNGADVISNSWGLKGVSNPNHSPAIVTAIDLAVTDGRGGLGSVVVIANGNNARKTASHPDAISDGFVGFPANVEIDGVLSVGASNRHDTQTDYSGLGDLAVPDQRVDVVAPSHNFYPAYDLSISAPPLGTVVFGKVGEGGEIYTIDMPGVPGYNSWKAIFHDPEAILPNYPVTGEELPASGTNYQAYTGRFGGTSAACPQVAGVAALLLSVAPCLTQQEVFDYIAGSADQVGGYDYSWDGLGRSAEFGFGRLNAEQALLDLIGSPGLVVGSFTVPVGTTTWTTPVTVVGEIHVPDGATLNINNTTAEFTQVAGINVERGGKLVVRNSTLTSVTDACGVEDFWRGIQVWGTIDAQQFFSGSNNGVVRIQEGSIVENARNAVRAARVNEDGEFDWFYNGGVIITNNATFRNNWRDVAFAGYHNSNGTLQLNNLSNFVDTEFITDNFLLGGETPVYHVSMHDVEGIHFSGCSFRNDITFLYPDVSDWGKGIRAIDAGFKVQPYCNIGTTGACPPANVQISDFSNLETGIEADGVSSMNTLVVDQTDFTNNQQGIILNGVDYATIVGNTFNVPVTLPTTFNGALGVYMNQCTGYEVEENVFNGPGFAGGEFSAGVAAVNSGNDPNQIYNNDFNDLYVGSMAMGDNRNGIFGLVIKCNNYSTCNYDIGLTFGGEIAQLQGTAFAQNTPAGNTFTHNCAPDNDNDFNAALSSGEIYYFTHNDIPPICYTTPLITTFSSGFTYSGNETASCPSLNSLHPIGSGGLVTSFKTKAQEAQNELDNLHDAIDNGDTQTLLNQINSNAPAGQTKNMLLNASPLSDEVLIAALLDRPTPLPNGHVMQIILANSPVTDDVMNALMNRNPSLSNGIINQINAAQTGISHREVIESQIAYWTSERWLAYNDAIRVALGREEIGLNTDSLRQIFDERGGEDDACLKAQAEIRIGNMQSATTILAAQQGTGVHNDICDYTHILLELAQSPEGIYRTNPQQAQLLLAMANDPTHKASVKAQAILNEVFGHGIVQPLEWPMAARRENIHFSAARLLSTDLQVMVYPNPATDWLTIEYPFDNRSQFRILDGLGRVVQSEVLPGGKSVATIEIGNLPGGTYYYQVLNQEEMVFSDRFMIVR